MSSNKKTPAVEAMSVEGAIKALVLVRDGLQELKAATDQLATVLGNLGALTGLAKDGVVTATAKPAARPPKPAPKQEKKPAAKAAVQAKAKPKAQAKPAPQEQQKAKPVQKPVQRQVQKTVQEPTEKRGDDVVRGSSVRRAPRQITLNIGSHPVRELAEQEAKDFLGNPKIFWYQPIRFPDPKRYQVQPRILSAQAVERRNPKFTRAPWTVSVTIEALGDDKRCAGWLEGVLTKNKSDQE